MNLNNLNMEFEVPVEKNNVSNKPPPSVFGAGFGFDESTTSSNRNVNNGSSGGGGKRFGTFSRTESDRSSETDDGSRLENDSLTFIKPPSAGASGTAAAANALLMPNSKAATTKSGSNSTTSLMMGTRVAEDELSHRLPRMLKLAVVGESTAGKTCICESICSEYPTFSEKYRLTCGAEIYAKTLKVNMKSDTNNENRASDAPSSRISGTKPGIGVRGFTTTRADSASMTEKVNMILLDSSGKDIYTELLPKYWGKLDGFILVIDLTSKLGLENAISWLELAQASLTSVNEKSKDENVVGSTLLKTSIIIGNKGDLKDQIVITSTAVKDFAKKYGLEYFECSVKENRGLQEAFQYIARIGVSQTAAAAAESSKKMLRA